MIDNDTLPVIVAICDERDRQLKVKGWTRAHDDTHNAGEIALAAAAFAFWGAGFHSFAWQHYPWPHSGEVLAKQGAEEALIKAAALCVAEIERLRRLRAGASGVQQVLSGCAVRAAIQRDTLSPPTIPPNPAEQLEEQRRQFMAAIDYCIELSEAGDSHGAVSFLQDWREGDVTDWVSGPDGFKGPFPATMKRTGQ